MEKYHINGQKTRRYLTLRPRIPESVGTGEDKETKRICFCPTVRQCIYSIVGPSKTDVRSNEVIAGFFGIMLPILKKGRQYEKIKNPAVYVTRKQLYVPDRKMSDFKLTEEMWALEKTTLRRKGFVDMEFLLDMGKVRLTQNRYCKAQVMDAALYFKAVKIHDDLFLDPE